MTKKICILCFSILFFSSIIFAADSKGNRKGQTARLGMKSGVHLMYLVTSPFLLEFPGEDWTFGLVYGSGPLEITSTTTTSSSTSTVTETWDFSTAELTGRYYIGNSFNIPFGIAMYNIHKDDWKYLNTTWELDYKITQFNIGIGNEWTYDWGGYLGVDWFQTGAKLSDKISVKLKEGTETSATKTSAEEESTDINAFGGAFIVSFGFGF